MPDDVDYANIVDGVLHSCSFRFPDTRETENDTNGLVDEWGKMC